MHKVASSLRSKQKDRWQLLLEHKHNFLPRYASSVLGRSRSRILRHSVPWISILSRLQGNNNAFKDLQSYRIHFQIQSATTQSRSSEGRGGVGWGGESEQQGQVNWIKRGNSILRFVRCSVACWTLQWRRITIEGKHSIIMNTFKASEIAGLCPGQSALGARLSRSNFNPIQFQSNKPILFQLFSITPRGLSWVFSTGPITCLRLDANNANEKWSANHILCLPGVNRIKEHIDGLAP